MSPQVCAVVVTFNRKELLRGCLLSLERQSQPPDVIVVINNCSTDGTKDMLEQEFPHLSHVHLEKNSGGAGGFHEGMKWAYEQGAEWLWVMDDDVEALPDALATMLQYRDISGFIHSRRVTNGEPFRWEGVWDVSSADKRSFPADVSFDNGRPWIPVNYGCFEGALIHRQVVERIGLPDKRFFMQGDDLVYGYLASLHTNVIYINHVGFHRKLPVAAANDKKFYLAFRNRFLTFEHLAATQLPLSRPVFWFQNLMLMIWYLRQKEQSGLLHRLKNARAMLSGTWDGMHGHFGVPPWIH